MPQQGARVLRCEVAAPHAAKAFTTWFMKRRKLTEVRRLRTCATTLPVAISKAAVMVCVPCRTYSLVQLRGFLARCGLANIQLACIRTTFRLNSR